MEVFEITGNTTGVSREGVNFLQPKDSYQTLENGFIYRQVLQSRMGIGLFCPRLSGETRITGIFEHVLPDNQGTELLATDMNFLYKFNTGTGVFDVIPFGGSMGPAGSNYAGFNIPANDFYISGTSYPTSSNAPRFVFTGKGISLNANNSAVFFYDGTEVLDFTDATDNTDYSPPISGALNRATYVLWFNERLNLIVPEIDSFTYTQGVLYSGIRTTSGNGDKFDVAGSGLLQADTYENITGATILGQVMALNFKRSNWTNEKTRDAFNPYFIRKVPSVLGTDAEFSAVSWNDEVVSIGKTGIIRTDGRTSLRKDNKIPYFTQDDMDQPDFNLTYGGFDRINNQFLWSFLSSGSEADTQDKVLVNNYEEETWSVYDLRLTVFGQTDVGLNLTWDDIDETLNPAWAQWDTTEEIWDRIGLGQSVQKTLAGDDLGFIYELDADFDDYYTAISNITPGATTVLTVSDCGIQVGDRVTVENVQGMTEINNYDPSTPPVDYLPYDVIAATPTSITINVDSSLFSAYTPNTGYLSKVINFKAETIPFNPYRDIGRRCFIGYIEFLIDTNGGNLRVDVYADEETTPYKQNVLLLPTSTLKAREWVTVSVNCEANFHTIVMRQESPSTQVKITSMRIHAAPGGLTSG